MQIVSFVTKDLFGTEDRQSHRDETSLGRMVHRGKVRGNGGVSGKGTEVGGRDFKLTADSSQLTDKSRIFQRSGARRGREKTGRMRRDV